MASKGDCSVILLQLQKLKRSLSFKTKSLRSKSADNFFQGTGSDGKLPADALPEIPSSRGSQPHFGTGSLSATPTRGRLQPPAHGGVHAFQEHIFKKPTFCDACSHMIVGGNTKQGLRCKACKMSLHHKCADSLGPQHCVGKLPKGFRRYYSSPLLIQEQFGCIREVMPIACGNKVDPVYEALRFGTSLAQKTKKGSSGSGSSSPNRNSISDLGEVPEEVPGVFFEPSRRRSNSVFTYSENGSDDARRDLKITNGPGFTKARRCGHAPGGLQRRLVEGENSRPNWVFSCQLCSARAARGEDFQVCPDLHWLQRAGTDHSEGEPEHPC
uniref:SH3 and cysteine-rich domain-containing protein isoform X4 n=1 Tax=Phascolarctos cinereus TaxID=38626 RepID=A0A6P5IN81_PHACI|nr:SH3 and cysteine-rich domain-containing protein isoform X4 [Phascolarctos cinereus]